MAGFYGYKSEAEFKAALGRELERLEGSPADRAREQSKSKSKPQKALKGKPNSKERLAHVAKVAGASPELVNAVGRDVAANKLLGVIRQLHTQGFSIERVQEAVALTVELDNLDVAGLIWESLPEDGSDDAYESLLRDAIIARGQKAEADAQKRERDRLSVREAMYEQEYAMAEATSPHALDAVDEIAQSIGTEHLYDEQTDPEVMRAMMRTGGLVAEGQRSALAQLNAQRAIVDEIKRGPGAPGSHWNDEERAKWEGELDERTVESASKRLVFPDEAAALAVDSVVHADGPTFMDELHGELEKLSTPPAHQDRLRDLAVEEWERQHPEHR